MTKHVEDTVHKYVEQLMQQHPGLAVKSIDGQSPWVDAYLKVTCSSHEQVDQVAETTAHLTTNFYIDEGVYITASATFTGPFS